MMIQDGYTVRCEAGSKFFLTECEAVDYARKWELKGYTATVYIHFEGY